MKNITQMKTHWIWIHSSTSRLTQLGPPIKNKYNRVVMMRKKSTPWTLITSMSHPKETKTRKNVAR